MFGLTTPSKTSLKCMQTSTCFVFIVFKYFWQQLSPVAECQMRVVRFFLLASVYATVFLLSTFICAVHCCTFMLLLPLLSLLLLLVLVFVLVLVLVLVLLSLCWHSRPANRSALSSLFALAHSWLTSFSYLLFVFLLYLLFTYVCACLCVSV